MIHNPWKTDIYNIDSIDIDIADIDISIYQYIDIDQASPVKGWQFLQSESHLLQPRAHISEQTKISESIIWKYQSTTKFHLVQIRLVWLQSWTAPFVGMANGHAYHMVVMPKLNRSLFSCMASENFDLLEVGGLGGVKINIFFRFYLILQSEGLGLDWKPRAKMLPSCLRIILPKMIIYRCHRQHWFDPDSVHKLHLVLVQSKVTKSGCLDPMRKQLDLVFGTGPASSPLTMWLCIELLRVELVPFCFNEFCELVLVSYTSCVSCLQLHWYQSLHV